MTQPVVPSGWTRFQDGDAAGQDRADTDLIDILDAVEAPVIVVGRDFTVSCFNQAAANVLRFAPSHIGLTAREVPALAAIPNLEERCEEIIGTGIARRVDFRDGEKSFVVRIAPYGKSDRNVAGAVLTFTNVTAFRASIEQAIYEREYTKAILNTVSHPLAVLGADQRVQTGNRAFYAMFRASRDQTQGVSLYELEEGVFAFPLLRTQLNELLAGANVFQPLEVDHSFPDVGLRTLCVDAHPLSLPGQSGRRILLTFQDITARKHAEGANARLAAIVESSDDAIVGKTIDGVITSWNSGAERIFGYAPGDVIGKPVTVLIPSDRHDEEPGILERIKCGERVEHYDTVRQRKDGTLVDVSLSVSPIKDATGRVIGASKIARDITQRKESQKRQEFLTQEIHHRTNNIFSVVQAVISRSFENKRTVDEAEQAVLSRLRSLAQTHLMLIEKEWHSADIAEVVRSEMSLYGDRITIEGPAIALNAKAAQNFGLAVHELATNAVKYGALSNQTGRVHISWSVAKPNGHDQFVFRWRERGGPKVSPPSRKGFGSTVLEQVMAEYFETPPCIEFRADGVTYEVIGSLEGITDQRVPS